MQIANRIIAVQLMLGVFISALWLLKDSVAAQAALGGAGIAILPSLYLRWRMFLALRLKEEPRQMVGMVYRGQVGKFALTCVLFALCVARFPQEFLPVMSTYVACLSGFVIGGLLVDHDQ